ncbi:RidA family protein [Roseateles violae]|uniref:Rid family detoxifying hydrolase n=1 Tax=Roseateles violae TaxID=3058042 RepID=A0ABT8DXI0_9BURK|nr:Rid family detoxifying hydrolase [Pelomonas sp. PFR6]MDN3921479.1 Rid family detoxifying hydrolase [Pelomonas sp. PFR6]
MTKKAIRPNDLPQPAGPLSLAIEQGGVLYVSGQVGLDPQTQALIAGGVQAQTEQVFRNLQSVLAAAGKDLSDVARMGVYLTNMSDFGLMNEVYARIVPQPFPARTTIGVAALPLGAAVEIDCVAN